MGGAIQLKPGLLLDRKEDRVRAQLGWRAVALEPVELLSICTEGPATLPASIVTALTALAFPRSTRAPMPVPARAVEARSTARASRPRHESVTHFCTSCGGNRI